MLILCSIGDVAYNHSLCDWSLGPCLCLVLVSCQHLVFAVETHLVVGVGGLDMDRCVLVKLVLSLSGISLVSPEFLGS